MSDDGVSCSPQAVDDAATGTWYIIPCPSEVKLSSVKKERGTHGSIYTIWECELRSPLWVGQSIPALVRSINENAVYSREKRLHASSLYRCLRGEARKNNHKSWKVEKFSRTDLEQLNNRIGIFPSVIYVSKSPELWRLGESSSSPPPIIDDYDEGNNGGYDEYNNDNDDKAESSSMILIVNGEEVQPHHNLNSSAEQTQNALSESTDFVTGHHAECSTCPGGHFYPPDHSENCDP